MKIVCVCVCVCTCVSLVATCTWRSEVKLRDLGLTEQARMAGLECVEIYYESPPTQMCDITDVLRL